MARIKVVKNFGFTKEMPKGRIFKGRFGCWCLKCKKLLSTENYPYLHCCPKCRKYGMWGYRFINNLGKVDFAEKNCFEEVVKC